MTRDGRIRNELKTPYKDGTTHVTFEPLDFMAWLAALVPKPRVSLTRFHAVFTPNSKYRKIITPAGRGKASKAHLRSASISDTTAAEEVRSPMEQRASMTWARRLNRVLSIDITECEKCQGPVKIIASIEDPEVIKKILNHLKAREKERDSHSNPLPHIRAPAQPKQGLFD